ncbi:MAG: MaoC family dehydratase, partial [Pedobacter sp.]
MVIINSFEEYKSYLGNEIGASQWHKINQEQIDKFAEATLDFQWIHCDQEKAKTTGPFGSTIAHG